MQDPILIKLKTDAGIVLADVWRALRHLPLEEEHGQQGSDESLPAPESADAARLRSDDLCYFHLN
jgi:hypothetical protein